MPLKTDRRNEWRFVLELYRLSEESAEGEQIAVAKVKSDFDPLVEASRFRRLQESEACEFETGDETAEIEPVWHTELNEPYVEAIRARVVPVAGLAAECVAPTAFFRSHAEVAASKVMEGGLLAENERFRYLVTAYRQEPVYQPQIGKFEIQPVAQVLQLQKSRLAEFMSRSATSGELDGADPPVFVPESLLDEIRESMQRAGAVETGGILLGHLHRDVESRTVFLEITAQIPARYTQQELTSLTFTPETWSDVDAAVELRDQSEIRLGWWHSHPAKEWCKNCPPENRKACRRSGEFFSSEDRALHRTIFPRAFSVGLVVSDSFANGLTFPMFGWRNGQIESRGFHVLTGT